MPMEESRVGRREFNASALAGVTAGLTLGVTPVLNAQQTTNTAPRSERMPSIFTAHGSPMSIDDARWLGQLRQWARALPMPRSILMISAHWVDRPITLGATQVVPLTYDFSGFERRFYEVTYRAPGAPDLARRVRELLGGQAQLADAPRRGLDHGAFIPLLGMYPDANVPVLQISIPSMEPDSLIALGRSLAPLRREGVLIVGSGFLTHNMRAADMNPNPRTPAWASEFDAWAGEALARRDVDAMSHYRTRSPGVRMALPTHEHFVPVLVALGASVDSSETVRFPITGFIFGSFTQRSVQFG